MRALSLLQPSASLVAWGEQRLVTVDFWQPHAGELVLKASQRFPRVRRALCAEPPTRGLLEQRSIATWQALPTGAVLAVADVVAWRSVDAYTHVAPPELAWSDWGFGRFVLELANVRPLRVPLPCPGGRGLWAVPAELVAAIRAQLAEARA